MGLFKPWGAVDVAVGRALGLAVGLVVGNAVRLAVVQSLPMIYRGASSGVT